MLVLSSKSYVSKQGAKLGIDSVRRNAPDAQVKDLIPFSKIKDINMVK